MKNTSKPLDQLSTTELYERMGQLNGLLNKADTPETKLAISQEISRAMSIANKGINDTNPDLVEIRKDKAEENAKLNKVVQEANQTFYREVTKVQHQCNLAWTIPTKDGSKEVVTTNMELLSVEGNFTSKAPNIEVLGEDGKYHNLRNGGIAEFRAVPQVLPYEGKKGKSIILFVGAIIANTEDLERVKPRAGYKLLENPKEGNAETFSKRAEKGAKKARQQEKTDKLQTAVSV